MSLVVGSGTKRPWSAFNRHRSHISAAIMTNLFLIHLILSSNPPLLCWWLQPRTSYLLWRVLGLSLFCFLLIKNLIQSLLDFFFLGKATQILNIQLVWTTLSILQHPSLAPKFGFQVLFGSSVFLMSIWTLRKKYFFPRFHILYSNVSENIIINNKYHPTDLFLACKETLSWNINFTLFYGSSKGLLIEKTLQSINSNLDGFTLNRLNLM